MAYGRLFEDALTLACRLHCNQIRKVSGIPYITHLLAVAAIVGENGGSEIEVAAGLLHDAIEDQGGAATRELLLNRFGHELVLIVDGCTDTDQTPKPPWRPRKEAYLARLPTASASVRLVAAADKLHNARSVLADLRLHGEVVWDRFVGGCEGSIWYYRSAAEVFKRHGPFSIAQELDRVVAEIERLAAGRPDEK